MHKLVEGFKTLALIPPSVAILGSSRAKPVDPVDLAAMETPRLLARAGFGIITGAALAPWRRPIRVRKVVLSSSSTLLTALAGIVVLKEGKHRTLKIIAAELATLGVVLVQL